MDVYCVRHVHCRENFSRFRKLNSQGRRPNHQIQTRFFLRSLAWRSCGSPPLALRGRFHSACTPDANFFLDGMTTCRTSNQAVNNSQSCIILQRLGCILDGLLRQDIRHVAFVLFLGKNRHNLDGQFMQIREEKTPTDGINMLVKRGRDIAGVVMDLAGIGHARTTQTRMVGFQPQSGAGLGVVSTVRTSPSTIQADRKHPAGDKSSIIETSYRDLADAVVYGHLGEIPWHLLSDKRKNPNGVDFGRRESVPKRLLAAIDGEQDEQVAVMLIESEVTILYKEVHIARQMIGHPRGLAGVGPAPAPNRKHARRCVTPPDFPWAAWAPAPGKSRPPARTPDPGS
ncbi:hypothetical protein GEV33_011536 [Tenebrio molitor]|uniref:Uncharacterized protein n=1 Tax=Tenebrio molitor TaxID=7067 RepID=A0A8J6HAU8_TENMO|nr:hypothetical protein GEV33_011536 [Tenebrio molitor]